MSVHEVLAGSFCALVALAALGQSAEDKAGPAPKGDGPEIAIADRIPKDAPHSRITGMPSKMHSVKLEKDKAYVIVLEGKGINPFVHVEDTIGNVLAQGHNRGNDQARVRFTSPKDDTFLIHASGIANAADARYTLSVKPYVSPPIKLTPLAEPTTKTASEARGVLSNDDAPDQFRDFPGKVFTVDLKAKRTYVLDMISTQFDTYLLLQDGNGAIIAQDDDSGGNLNSRIRFTPPASGRYRLVASTFNGRMGEFKLRVTETP